MLYGKLVNPLTAHAPGIKRPKTETLLPFWCILAPMTDKPDLFGHTPAQGSLFGSGEDRLQAPQQSAVPDPAVVRLRLHGLLEKARSAQTMPWSERDAKMWQTVFPNMANWLPPEEAEQLRLDFEHEMRRLTRAA
jgi:hypothetical protein